MTLGVETSDAELENGRSLRINWRNCIASIELRLSFVALSNVNSEVESKEEFESSWV